MAARKPIKVEDRTFPSLASAALNFEVSEGAARKRLRRGWTPEEAFGVHPPPEGHAKRITVKGVEYPSINEAARALGVKPANVHLRLQRGHSFEEAFSSDNLPVQGKKVKVGGKQFNSIKEAAEYYGVAVAAAQWRVRNGWTIKQALELDQPPLNSRQVEYQGKIYPTVTALANEYGLNPDLVRRRLVDYGYSVEEALGLVDVSHRGKPIHCTVDGRDYPSRADACRHYGVDPYVVSTRINGLGWTIEQALEIAPRPRYELGVIGCVYEVQHKVTGKIYIGITKHLVADRWQQHVDKALTTKRPAKGGLHEAIKRDGVGAFVVREVETGKSVADLATLERQYIRKRDCLVPSGYNISRGGSGLRSAGVKVTVQGKKFPSYQAAAKHFGINPGRVVSRLHSGYDIEQALGLKPLNPPIPSAHAVEIDGLSFATIKEAASHYGQPANRVRNRLHDGWSLEDALKKNNSSKAIPVTIDGKQYKSIRAAAKALGIPNDTLRNRLKRNAE